MSVGLASRLHGRVHDDFDEAKREIMDALGDLTGFELAGSQVLVADYVRPAVSKGIKLPGSEMAEDVYQGKCGLVIWLGYKAFPKLNADGTVNDYEAWNGHPPIPGEWVYFSPAQAMQLSVCGAGSKMWTDTYDVPVEREVRKASGFHVETVMQKKTEPLREWKAGWPCRLIYAADIFGRVARPSMVV